MGACHSTVATIETFPEGTTRDKMLEAVFNALDKNGNGSLTVAEYDDIVESSDAKTKTDMQKVFDGMDKAGTDWFGKRKDHKIGYTEYHDATIAAHKNESDAAFAVMAGRWLWLAKNKNKLEHAVATRNNWIDHLSFDKMTAIAYFFVAWFSAMGVFGLLFPEALIKTRGGPDTSEFGTAEVLILMLSQHQSLHSLLMALLHLVLLRKGAPEIGIPVKEAQGHHLISVRTLLLCDTLWLASTCAVLCVSVVPEMHENGWHDGLALVECLVLGILAVVSFCLSRGDTKKPGMLHYFTDIVHNGAEIDFGKVFEKDGTTADCWLPKTRNRGLLFWMIVSGSGAISCILLSKVIAAAFVHDLYDDAGLTDAVYIAKTDKAEDMIGIIVQMTGICLLSEALTILAILGGWVVTLQYSATRYLWMWCSAICAFYVGSMQMFTMLRLSLIPLYVCIGVSAIGAMLAQGSLDGSLDAVANATPAGKSTGTNHFVSWSRPVWMFLQPGHIQYGLFATWSCAVVCIIFFLID